ncbi:methyltransferase family protein [Cupriavidus necator]
MFARAGLAFVALPGVVAFAVPGIWLLASSHTARSATGSGVDTRRLGCFVRDFYVSGKGTLAPWAPPVQLVVVGLYRYTRNPMYISLTLILLGWAMSFGLPGLYIYAIIVAVAFHLRVVFGEEPWLARTHGAKWHEYARRVPRRLL